MISKLSEKKTLLKNIKKFAGNLNSQLIIPVGNPAIAMLRPISTNENLMNSNDVAFITKWRNRYVSSFLTEFEATNDQTANWLINIVGPSDSKILFMIDDLNNQPFGYMGISFINWERNYGEADAIVRGAYAPPGTMTMALKTLINWSKTTLGLKEIGVRVRSDNSALAFYKKFGFIEEKRIPLKKIKNSQKICFVENALENCSGISLVYMRLNND
ncbi:MAG: GNAT family N-acetyltransferase [Parachlamydiales bacterium]|nr:GNAT family N-acetyltransferase [Parachlamydiales bacterium]